MTHSPRFHPTALVALAGALWAVPSTAHACVSGADLALLVLVVGAVPMLLAAGLQLSLARVARDRLLADPSSWLGRGLVALITASAVGGLMLAFALCAEGAFLAGVPLGVVEYAVLWPLVRGILGLPRHWLAS